MLVLTKSDIQNIFSMQEAINTTKEALALYSSGKSVVPLRTVLDISKFTGKTLFMPAYVDTLDSTGIKIVSVYPNNSSQNKPVILGKMLLLDAASGDVVSIMDGTYLTQLRTGALQGAGTDILARINSKIAALIGTGGQAETQLEALLNARNLDEVRIYSLDFKKAQIFTAEIQNKFSKFKTKFIVTKNADLAIHDADIITAITTSKTPVFNASFVKPGAHINGIGSYTHDMQELPEEILINANKIFFDTNEGVLSEAGDILIPLKSGKLQQKDLHGELGDVILGKTKGRESNLETTVFKAVGSAVFDVVLAKKIYDIAIKQNAGSYIKL